MLFVVSMNCLYLLEDPYIRKHVISAMSIFFISNEVISMFFVFVVVVKMFVAQIEIQTDSIVVITAPLATQTSTM